MQKVICIDNSDGASKCAKRMLIEGDIYTAVQSSDYNNGYFIKEALFDPLDGLKVSFEKRRFVPLSTIDETELLEQRNNHLQGV